MIVNIHRYNFRAAEGEKQMRQRDSLAIDVEDAEG